MTKTTTVTAENNITSLRPHIIEGIQERKGRSISVVDLSGIESAPVSEFIICQ